MNDDFDFVNISVTLMMFTGDLFCVIKEPRNLVANAFQKGIGDEKEN